jgi:hypothetical protein
MRLVVEDSWPRHMTLTDLFAADADAEEFYDALNEPRAYDVVAVEVDQYVFLVNNSLWQVDPPALGLGVGRHAQRVNDA